MKKFLFFIILFCFASYLSAQVNINATVQINGFRHNYNCSGDAGGLPDPRYKVWVGYNSGSFLQVTGPNEYAGCLGSGVFGGDNISCSTFNPGLINAYTITNQPATTINVDMQSWEEDGCGSECTYDVGCFLNEDDNSCGRLRIGDFNVYAYPPCTTNVINGAYNTGNFLSMHGRCAGDGGDYGINQLNFYWSFASSPTITTQPTNLADGGADRTLCIGTGTTLNVAVNVWNGWSLGRHYQWQVAAITSSPTPSSGCPASGWVNIPGATSASYVPPQTPGTLMYRCLITSNCTPTFTSQTVATECVRITYQPYAAPVTSSVCGLSISPGTPYTFCIPDVPNAGAAIGSTPTWSVSPSAGVTITPIPSSTCVDITFTTPATYTVSTTFADACPAVNPSSSCTVTIANSACGTIYVDAATGNDANFGYETTPVATMNRAFALITSSRTWIRVARGTYNESNILNLQNNVVVEGGWVNTAGIWTKSTAVADATTINFSGEEVVSTAIVHRVGFKADNDDGWALQDLILNTTNTTGQAANGNGKSNMVISIVNGCDNYSITRCRLTAGNATAGAGATAVGWQGSATYNGVPTDPFDGNNGQNGANGNGATSSPGCDGCFLGCDQTGGVGGTTSTGGFGGNNGFGGAAGNGGSGGAGGVGGDDIGSGCGTGAQLPSNGSAGTGASPGAGGTALLGCTSNGGDNSNPAWRGANAGAAGAAGTNGANGTVGAGSYSALGFTPANGGNGTPGSPGSGGGGGAGAPEDTDAVDEPGVGGGGGGAGGGGGGAGRGGGGGGSSFPIYIFNNGTGGNITDVQIISGTAGTAGNGGTGGSGGTGGTGNSSVTISGLGYIMKHCGDANFGGGGGNGSAGGNGGNGGNGAAGLQLAICFQGSGSAPTITTSPSITANVSTSGGTVPNPINLGVNYNENGRGCVNSEINISRNLASTWTLPAAASLINDLTSTTSSFTLASNNASIGFNSTGVFDLGTNSTTYQDVIRITDGSRVLPVISSNPTVICSGAPFSLSATTWGTEVDFEWIVFSTTAAAPILSSSLPNPTFTLTVGTATTYNVRYRVKEQCCGWSTPVYGTITVNPPVGTPSTPIGTTAFCFGSTPPTAYTSTAPNAASYSWTILAGTSTITGSSTTGTATFDPTFTGLGQVCVQANGCAGPSTTVCTTINISPNVGTPAVPVGITSRCIGLGVDTFSTFASNATSYNWTVTGVGNGTGASDDTTTITWSSSFSGTANVCVSANGCGGPSPSVCVAVNVLPPVGAPIAPIGITTICQDALNSEFISNASDASNYSWSLTAGAGTITTSNDSVTVDWDPAFSGTAQVCVVSSGCGSPQGPVCTNVTVNPTVGLPSAPSGVTARCVGGGTDSYATSAVGASSYIWLLTPAAAGSISPSGTVTWNSAFTGTAIIGVIANGCNGPSDTSFTSVVVGNPVGTPTTPSGTLTRCEGIGSDAYTTSASDASSYVWSVTPAAAGSISGSSGTESVNWSPSFNGTASVCVQAVGCGTSSTVCQTVTVNAAPPIPTISNTGPLTFCDGGFVVLTSSSAVNNSWLPNGETTASINATTSGTYAVTVTNANGCSSTSSTITVVVFANDINPTLTYPDTVCVGESFNMISSGTGVASYLWSTGETTSFSNGNTITTSTVYQINMTATNGCQFDSTFTIYTYLVPNAVDDNTTTNQDTAVTTIVITNDNMSGNLTIISQPANGTASVSGNSITYTPNSGFFGTETLTYQLCSPICPTICDTAVVTIIVNQVTPLIIMSGMSPNGDGKNDVFIIQGLENYPNNRLSIINRWGDLVFEAAPYNNDWGGNANVGIVITENVCPDGSYFYVFIPEPGATPIKGAIELRR